MIFVYAAILTLLNAAWLFVTILGLPGNWLMVLGAAGLAWWQPGMFSLWTLGTIAGLALLGELMEFLLGAAGAKKGGGSMWGALGAILGAVVGGVIGTGVLPIIGTIIGACIGAFAGALGFEMALGKKKLVESVSIGKGAAIGRFWGTIAKLTVGVMIWGICTVAAFV